nr:HD domain-containing protein [Lachnospiraceae bacterium]
LGAIFLLLAGLCFLAHRNLEDYGVGMSGRYTVSTITAADISSDDAMTVVADNFETVLLLDNMTSEVRWLKSTRQICDGYAQIGKVFFDEQNRVYVQVTRYDDDYRYVEEEIICQFDLKGNEINRFVIPEIHQKSAESKIRGFKCKDGFVYYYNEDISELVRMDTTSGEVEVYGTYDSEKIENSFMLGFTEDDTVALAYIDGSLALGNPDGSVQDVGRINYRLSEEGTETIVNQYLYFGGKHYVTDGRYFDTIYEFKDGELEKVIDLNDMLGFGVLLEYDYYSYALSGGISAHDNGNGKVLIAIADNLFYTCDMEEFFMMDMVDTYILPSAVCMNGLVKIVAQYLMYIFALLGFVLVCGSIMKWRLSLRSKLFIIIMPITLGGILLVTYYEMNTIEKDFVEQQYETYDAISSFYRNQLDSELLASVESLDDADKLEQVRLALMKNMEENASWTDRVNINVYKYFDNGVHLLLYSTTTDCLFVSSFLFDFEMNQQYRLGDSDTYHYETKGIATTYLDSITYLRDENGDIYGFIDVYGDLEKLRISQNKIKEKVILITVILGLILGVLLYVLAYYIVRQLRMTSKTVGSIAKGNFKARVEKITKDELGVISAGVNDMADKIEDLFEEQEEFSVQVIETLVGTIDAKDKYTNGHSVRVAKYSRMIAQRLGKSDEECKQIYYVGLLHDIGKIGIPDEIISKPSKLTDEEFAVIKTHPEVGYNLLNKLSKIENVSVGAHYHHERFDGRGYPEGLKGEEIPEIARIIAVADTYDAMTSNRSYRNAMSQEKVRSELEKGKGTQFDAKFADVMLEIDLEIQESIYRR